MEEETLNNSVLTFPFGRNEKNSKPPEIPPNNIKKSHIKPSASETASLLRHLGMLIGDRVPRDSLIWKLYVSYNGIVNVLNEKSYHVDCLTLIKHKITEDLKLYVNDLKQQLIPKQYHMLDFSRIMELCSPPLSHLSSLASARKHKPSKYYAQIAICRKDFPFIIIAIRNQLRVYHFFSSSITPSSLPETGPRRSILTRSLENFNKYHFLLYDEFPEKVEICNWLGHKNRVYSRDDVVVCISDEWPNLFRIQEIFKANDEFYFIAKTLISYFDEHFQAYEIHISSYYALLLSKNVDNVTFLARLPNGKYYVPSKR